MTANVHQQNAEANSHGKEDEKKQQPHNDLLHKSNPWLISAGAGWWSNYLFLCSCLQFVASKTNHAERRMRSAEC